MGDGRVDLADEVPRVGEVMLLDKSLLPDYSVSTLSPKNVMFKYIVPMGKEMGLECITEGVETEEHIRLLEQNDCKLAQGFYFDQPLPIKVFESRLADDFRYNK